MLTFEQIIDRLNTFWATQNCIIHQGYDLEVGAGTFNPATFLGCLGEVPYRVAYVELCRRPKNTLHGNLCRFQLSHQYQVLLKPIPTNVRILYLNSLCALDFELKKHDFRFIHKDWETSTLGISGLGWEIWCDGVAITQFTYLQTVGDIALRPISTEITYDLEKLALFVQSKSTICGIQYNHIFTFHDLFFQSETEWSHYNARQASVPMWLRHFNDYEEETKNLVKNNLPIPAYDFIIKASHAFNLLEARGAISFDERNNYMKRIRALTHLVAKSILSKQIPLSIPSINTKLIIQKNPGFNPKNTRDFLLEIGSEQLPGNCISIGCLYLENAMRTLLESAGLEFEEMQVFGTPQRLGILVKNLVEGTETAEEQIKGPSLEVAFDEKGNLTQQGKGFFLHYNLSFCTLSELLEEEVPNLYSISIRGTNYLVATVCVKGKSTYELLQKNIPSLIVNINFPKKMYWEDPSITYARPIQWILALFGTQVIPFNIGKIPSNNFSFGHFQISPVPIEIKHPKHYLSSLRNHYVLADIEERRTYIENQIKTLEQQIQGYAIQHPVLLEILQTTEWPTLALGFFDTSLLRIPKEVLVAQIIKHKKYFPVIDRHDQLMPIFIMAIDNHPNQAIQSRNEKALFPLLSEIASLYEREMYNPLELVYYKLQGITYQKKLKDLWNKVKRLNLIATMIHKTLNMAELIHVQRAALLSKSDLCSALVNEFPHLQGVIGKHYALAQNENPQVAMALQEQWMPRSKYDSIPKTPTGIVLSLADKIDDLINCHKNLYTLRKQATGIILTLLINEIYCNLQLLIVKSCNFFPLTNKKKIAHKILNFIAVRKKLIFEDWGFQKDEIEAISSISPYDPFDQLQRLKALHCFRQTKKQLPCLIEAYKRITRQICNTPAPVFNSKLIKHPSEKKFLQELSSVSKYWSKLLKEKQYLEAFELLTKLQFPLEALFKNVVLLADDPVVRSNRCALLRKALTLFETLIDFNKFSSF